MRVVLLGPPGAGKGTQAAAIRKHLVIPHISTGDMLRGAIAAASPLGLKAKAIIESGNLVPDDVMAQMVGERLAAADAAQGFLLDGYPRTLGQAQTLDSILTALGQGLDHVLYLALDDAEIESRLSGRRTCGACGRPYHVVGAPPAREGICDACSGALVQRPDDRQEVIARRLAVYREQTEPVIGFYRRHNLLREVDAAGDVAAVERRLLSVFGAIPEGGRQ